MSKIPLIIHQIWLDPTTDTNRGPCDKYDTDHYTLSVPKVNPSFRYYFWNMQAVRDLFEDPRLIKWKRFYFDLDTWIEKCDFARYAIMFIIGGVYIDCDFTALRPLDSLISKSSDLLLTVDLRSWGSRVRNPSMTQPAAIFNGFLGSVPNHIFWSELMDYIMYRYDKSIPVLYTTGPVAVGEFAQLMHYSIDDCPKWYVENRLINWRKSESTDEEAPYLHSNHFDGTNWSRTPSMMHKFATYMVRRSTILTTLVIIMAIILVVIIITYFPQFSAWNHFENGVRSLSGITVSSQYLWSIIGIIVTLIGYYISHSSLIKSAENPRLVEQCEKYPLVGVSVGIVGIVTLLRVGALTLKSYTTRYA
jgi:mannosyltransferase OCH1-like enzyme